MNSLRRTASGIVAALILVPPALVGTATTASAQTTTCDVRPRGTTFVTKPKTIDFDVPSARYWTYEQPEIGLYVYDTAVDGADTSATIDPGKLKNADARWHTGTVARTRNSDGVNDTCQGIYRLKRGTRISISKVEKIRHGRKITGKLERVNWGPDPDRRWATYSGQNVTVEFLNRRGRWEGAGYATTKQGTFVVTKQIGERPWRAYFQGTNISGAAYSPEVVG